MTKRCRNPRTIASEWHSGQWSAMYAYTSTGTILKGLQWEISRALNAARGKGYTAKDRNDLRCLRKAVNEEIREKKAKKLKKKRGSR